MQHEADAAQWDCRFCQDKKMQEARNCGLPGQPKHKDAGIRVIDEVFTGCPVSSIDTDSSEVIRIVNMCEGEMGGVRLPSQVMAETAYYHNVRSIVLGEQGRLYKIRQNKEKSRKRR